MSTRSNSNKFYRTIKWVDTLASPEIKIILCNKNGNKENIEIYGGAWKEGGYLHYNDVQYKVKNIDEFYDDLKFISNKIQSELE